MNMGDLGRFRVSAPCRSCWQADQRPAEVTRFLRDLPAELQDMRATGAAMVEFHADICVINETYASTGLWTEVAGLLEQQGLGATVHLPFAWVDLASLDRSVWEGSVRSVETAMNAVAPLHPSLAVVHPTNHATWAVLGNASRTDLPVLYDALATRLVAALHRLRKAPGGSVLALENLEGMPLDLYVQVLAAAQVGACLDVGHVISNGDDVTAAVQRVSDRLVGLHVHDAVPSACGQSMGRAHLPFGAGVLDLARLLEQLAGIDFSGPLVPETTGNLGEAIHTLLHREARGKLS